MLFSLLSSPSYLLAQSEDLFTSIREDVKSDESLLPERMIFTQRLLWGESGLFRITGVSTLNIKQREKELKLRRSMLKVHQIIGY